MTEPEMLRPGERTVPPSSILMVDDNPANIVALEAVLQPLGHPLVRATSGEEALRRVLDFDFALILMDAQMPGLDGFQTATLIKQRERTSGIPLLFMSAVYRENNFATKGYAIGAVDYIVKPFEPDLLRAKVGAIINDYERRERQHAHALELFAQEQKTLAEQALRKAAETTNRLKDEFIAKLSHELRSPMQVIVGWAALLRAGQVPQAAMQKALDAVYRNALIQTRLVDDLLDTARITSGKLRLVRRVTRLDEVLSLVAREAEEMAASRGVRLESSLQPCESLCDAERMHQIVSNLLGNAVKFSNEGGRVDLQLEATADSFEIRVADQGVGVAPEALPHVFDAFWQGRNHASPLSAGLGLGLTIVRELVELHGGQIVVESAGLGRGTTFIIRMPRWIAEVEPAQPAAAHDGRSELTRLDRVRILVLDDDADARDLLAVLLWELGAHVTPTHSVESALSILAEQPHDILISDLVMPQEDGFSFIKKVRGHGSTLIAELPAIAMSAHGDQVTRARAIQDGFQDFVGKPFQPVALVETIRRVMSRGR